MKYKKYTKEGMEVAIKSSTSWAGVCRFLGASEMSGSQMHIKAKAISFDISYDHFPGKGWNKGKHLTRKKMADLTHPHYILKRLIKNGDIEHKCMVCGLTEWFGKKVPIEYHHIDKNPKNNDQKNRLVVCSNCHSYIHKWGCIPTAEEIGLDPIQ